MGRTFAVSDLHGCLNLWKQIEKFLEPDDKIYVLGDCGDRGPEPWETIKAVAANPQAIYIKGNHEDMLYHALVDWTRHGVLSDDYWLLVHNGGENTFEGWMRDGEKEGWIKYLKDLPKYATYTNTQGFDIFMTHAGFNPNKLMSTYSILWGRSHFSTPWTGLNNQIVVHGHTPVQYLAQELGLEEELEPGALWYCDNHKICLDCGSFDSNYTTVLDLDTFDEHIFMIEGEK